MRQNCAQTVFKTSLVSDIYGNFIARKIEKIYHVTEHMEVAKMFVQFKKKIKCVNPALNHNDYTYGYI